MEKCPKCGSQLSLMLANNRPCLVCPNCMAQNMNPNNFDLIKCEHCETWYCNEIEKMCPCRKLKEVID